MANGFTKTKYVCFTYNNYTELDVSRIRALAEGESPAATYLICAKEVSESGTPHLQGYIEFVNRKTLRQLKTLIGAGAHLESRKGTSTEASEYCTKEDPAPLILGTISKSKQGKRSDLDAITTMIKEGASKRAIAEAFPGDYLRYHSGIDKMLKVLAPQKDLVGYPLESFSFSIEFEEGYSHIIVGPSGCGKTSYARSRFPKALMVSHKDDLLKFDKDVYQAIIFDDMSFSHEPRTAQIHLVDQDDDRSIHCRYSTAFIPAGTIKIFTTNVTEIFDISDPAIKRRIKIHQVQ